MVSILEGQLADILTSRLQAAGIPFDVAIVRNETDDDPFNPTTATVDYTASGWLDTYAAQDIDGTLIKASDVRAFVVCSSCDITPTTTDKLVANSNTYTIQSVQRDPAGACWIVQARF